MHNTGLARGDDYIPGDIHSLRTYLKNNLNREFDINDMTT